MTKKHKLSQKEALSRIQSLLGDMKKKHGDKINDLQESWSGSVGRFSFKAMGFSVSGTLEVTASEVKLNGQLPFAASFFKGQIESAISEHADKLLIS